MLVSPLVIVGLGLAAYIAWCIGTNDAANPTDTAVGSGALTLNYAVALFSVFAFVGAVLQGWMVIKTFGRGIANIRCVLDAVVASLTTAMWITLASYRGLPISTTQSSVGAVLGIGLTYLVLGYPESINLSVLTKVFLSWVVSPLGAIALAATFYKSFTELAKVLSRRGYDVDKVFRALLIANLAYSAYSFGANDVGNATGVYVAVVTAGGASVKFTPQAALPLAALGAAGISLGAFTLGKRVIRTVAYRITRLDYITGSAAELANALIVWLFTTIPMMVWGWGMPISTTHASVSAVLGVGLAKYGRRGVNWGTFAKIIASWLLTVPITALTSLTIRYSIITTLHV